MYYLIYIPLYLVSLLPWRVLYFFGDLVYGILYYILGYRKQVVMNNLLTAFPEKTEAERKKIAKEFYHNFVDNFIETIKFFSLSEKDFAKRFSCDVTPLDKAYASGKPIHIIGMHNFNWEFANWGMARLVKYPFVVIYMPVGNKTLDKIIMRMRMKFGTILIPATDFKRSYASYAKTLHILVNVGDQSPGSPSNAFWLNFFGKPTAFVMGPEKGARVADATIVFGHFYKTKRGYYRADLEFVTSDPNSLPEGELMKRYVAYIEKCLRKVPSNYLWSHRRWKHEYREEYGRIL